MHRDSSGRPPDAETRDRFVRLLRRSTMWVAGGAVAAMGILSAVAAITLPGRSDASPQAAGGSAGASSSAASAAPTPAASGAPSTVQPIQAPAAAPAPAAVSAPSHAATGGSHR